MDVLFARSIAGGRLLGWLYWGFPPGDTGDQGNNNECAGEKELVKRTN
jgi:hypothetical protein